MISATTLLAFALVALSMVMTPGPNMAYLVSRSICQGRVAGLVSLERWLTGTVLAGLAVRMALDTGRR